MTQHYGNNSHLINRRRLQGYTTNIKTQSSSAYIKANQKERIEKRNLIIVITAKINLNSNILLGMNIDLSLQGIINILSGHRSDYLKKIDKCEEYKPMIRMIMDY